MPNKKVIDVSHWNTVFDFKKAKAAGVLGVIIKATEGPTYKDPKAASLCNLAKDAGLMTGFYHFMRRGDQRQMADFFCATVRGITGGSYANVLMAADHEDATVSVADLGAWLQRVQDNTGVPPVIYSGHVLKDQGGASGNVNSSKYQLWLAQYTSGQPSLPAGWSSYWLWQWTDKGDCDGLQSPVDLNHYDKSDDNLIAEWGQGGWGAPPEPKPEPIAMLTQTGIQEALNDGGYGAGPVDGLYGPNTAGAFERWFKSGKTLPY